MRVARCVLPHTQRCHESKACTSPATALYFSSKQTATATAGGRRASVERVGTGGEGRRRGGAVIDILPPPLRCPPVRHRWQAIPRASCPPLPPPPRPPCPKHLKPRVDTGGEGRRMERAAVRRTPHSRSALSVPARLCTTAVRYSGCVIKVSSTFPPFALSLCGSCRSIFPFAFESRRRVGARVVKSR